MSSVPTLNRPPAHMRFASGATGQVPVRFDGAPEGPFEGQSKWVGVANFEHSTLCRAFGLDPVRFSFDLPSSVRGIGAAQQGHGGGASARLQSGFVFLGPPGKSTPVAKLTICRAGELVYDGDPNSRRDFENLGRY